MSKRILSMLLVLIMLLGMIPTGVLAAEEMTVTFGANLTEANAKFSGEDYQNSNIAENVESIVFKLSGSGEYKVVSMMATLDSYDTENYRFVGWKIAAGGKEYTATSMTSEDFSSHFSGVFDSVDFEYSYANAKEISLELKSNASIAVTAMFEKGAEAEKPHLKITSNVTDETVKVFTSPEIAMGGETIDMEYDGGRKDIKAVPNFFIGTDEYAFSHYIVNGVTYEPAAGTVNVTNVDGFEGTIRYYYATAPQITVFAGTMSKDMEVQFVYEKLEPTFNQITVTSNVWDSSVEVLDTPTAVMGGQTFPLSYRGKELELHAKKYVTVEGQRCNFSHFLVNGVRYEAGNNPQILSDVAGFDGSVTIFTNSASYRGLRFNANGTLSGNVTVEFVYKDVPEHIETPKFTPVVTLGDSYGQSVSTEFVTNQGEASVWTVTGVPAGAWYKLSYVTDGTNRFDSADGKTAQITVTAEGQAFQAFFGSAIEPLYNETDADEVTVNVTISNDGVPLLGADGETVLANLDVTVPYFDLASYGLEKFYRYGTKFGWDRYTNDELIQRPTALHVYIYMLERYYMGLPEEQCCTGESGLLEYNTPTEVKYMDGTTAYETGRTYALTPTQDAMSLYMKTFWGHDENLMYFINHEYPLMSQGVGSTCDYILLEDGDRIDVAMFTDWNFYVDGGFNQFSQDEYTIMATESVTTSTFKAGTSAAEDGNSPELEAISTLKVAVYDADWQKIADVEGEGTYTYTFNKAGTYYLMAVDPIAMTKTAHYAPATAKVIVTPMPEQDENGVFLLADAEDMAQLETYINEKGHKNVKAAMVADIDISALEWNALTEFTGEFDGRAHTLTVKLTDTTLFEKLYGTVKNLTVDGTVTSNTVRLGGIAGVVCGGAVLENCVNKANITGTHDAGNTNGIVGGIASIATFHDDRKVTITNCANYGTIQGNNISGGIIGADYNSKGDVYTGCENHGAVSGTQVGGILGQSADETVITECFNDAKVTGKIYAGGILGKTDYYNNVTEKSANTGAVSAQYAGGIVGFNYGEIDSCYNTGAVSGTVAAGGITGATLMCQVRNTHTNDVGKVVNCYSVGTVTGEGDVGAATGQLSGGDVGKRTFQVYALEDTAQALVGKFVNEASNNRTAFKTETELKSEEMLTLLGGEYKEDTSLINQGFPVLLWQEGCIHDWQDATCAAPMTCKLCGKTKGEAADHAYEATEVAATCLTDGYTEYKCSVCGYSYRDNFVEATGHDTKDTVIAPTHDTMGYTLTSCANCDYSSVHTFVEALGHDYVRTVTKEATCTTEGEWTFKCDCGESYTMPIPTTGHDCDKVVVEATCETMGYTTYTCKHCDFTCISDLVPATKCPSKAFTDVDTTLWYHEAVDYVVANGLMNGTSATTFEPMENTTRAMVATLLYRIAGEPDVSGLKNPFTDVTEKDWFCDAVVWAFNEGVVTGATATIFNPNDKITREQLAVMLWRYADKPEADESVLNAFSDVKSVGEYAKAAMAWAVETKLVNGLTATTLVPTGTATRAQIATILMRYTQN